MKHKTRTKALSWLLSLALALSLVPGMSLTALAWDGNPYASLVNTTTTVTFNGKPWYIIADNSTAADAGTVTLLAADTSFDLSAFSSNWSNNYSNSTVKGYLEKIVAGTAGDGKPDFKDVADAIVTNTDTGGKLYLLSKSEANALSSAVLKMNFSNGFGCWWLRSPGDSYCYATYVNGQNGQVDGNCTTYMVSKPLGVRPALKLNLSSVIFSSESNSFTLKPAHTHSFTYSASGATITATCANTDQKCPLPDDGNGNHTATLTIKPPANLVYDGKAKAATVEGEIPDVTTPDIMYEGRNGTTYVESTAAPTEKGDYTASVTLGEKTAGVDFTIKDASYTIIIPAKLTVENAGWNATAGITASGEIAEGTKLTVTAASANEWKLKDGENTVDYYLATEEGGEPATVWDFTVDELAAENGTTKAMGAVVEEYINKPAGDYADTVTFTAKVEVAKTAAEKPDIAQADCTFSPSNGKSTLSNANITTSMEYSADNGTTWTDVTSNGSIASLAAGTVQIRVKETDEKLASEAVSITVPEVLHINELVGPYTGDRLTCEYYAGETWQALVDRYGLIKAYSGRAAFGSDGFIYYNGSMVPVTDLVDNTKTYEVQ